MNLNAKQYEKEFGLL